MLRQLGHCVVLECGLQVNCADGDLQDRTVKNPTYKGHVGQQRNGSDTCRQ